MVGNGMGAKNGIMFKTAVSLEETGKMQIVALDKTGTITSGEPKVTDMIPAEAFGEELLGLLMHAGKKERSTHWHMQFYRKPKSADWMRSKVEDFQAVPGNGLSAVLAGKTIYGGNKEIYPDKDFWGCRNAEKGRRSGGRRKDTFVLCERRSAGSESLR